ncbi:MAG TPA: cytochrome c biogenesis protein CcdA [Bacillota bacterium]|nr:cytochrome c biogenesis protein CcdA [Bacillota bacterium]
MEITSVLLALVAGVLSFLSPCILPVAPGYLSIVSGVSLASFQDEQISRKKVLAATTAFILGFSLVFTLLGVTSSLLGQLLRSQRVILSQIGGVIIIFLGLHQAGWLPLTWLYHEKRFGLKQRLGICGAFVTGLTFAFGWTPCVGPILSSILALAGSKADMIQGTVLLILYSLGLSLPFFLLAIAFERVSRGLGRIKPYLKYLEWVSGLLLIVMGLLLLTGNFTLLIQALIRLTGGWNFENLLQL